MQQNVAGEQVREVAQDLLKRAIRGLPRVSKLCTQTRFGVILDVMLESDTEDGEQELTQQSLVTGPFGST